MFRVFFSAEASIDFSASCHTQTHFTQRLASSQPEGACARCANNTNVSLSRDRLLRGSSLSAAPPRRT